MNIHEIEKILDIKLKKEIASEWDNVGLLIGRKDKEVQSILLALELTKEVLQEAIEKACDMIICHHPLIFSGIKKIVDPDQEMIYSLIRHDIGLYAAHTNFDMIEHGLNDYFAGQFDVEEVSVILEENNEGLLRIFEIPAQSIYALASDIKKKFNTDYIRLIGDENKTVQKVGLVTGSGADYAEEAFRLGVDVFITGDVKYHQAMEFLQNGWAVLDAGHFETEKVFSSAMKNYISKNISEMEAIELILSQKENNPFQFI